MSASNSIANRGAVHVANAVRVRQALGEPRAAVACEALEARKLLTTFLYEVPSGHSAAYIQPKNGGLAGQLQIRLDSLENDPVDPNPFENRTGMDIIDAGDNEGFVFVDLVGAALKPTATILAPNDHGILVRADSNSGATLLIDRRTLNDDVYMSVTESTSSQTTVQVYDIAEDQSGYTRFGEGVTNLTLRTNDVAATAYYPTFGGGTDVVVRNLADDVFLTVDTGSGRYDRIWLGTNESLENGRIHEEAIVITGAGRCQVTVRGASGAGNTSNARIDFGPRGAAGTHTGHNLLEVLVNGVATLAQLAGASHNVVVEEVNLQSDFGDKPAQLYVEDPSEIDDLDAIEWADAYVQPSADGTLVDSFLVNDSCQAFIQGNSTIGEFTIEGDAQFTASSDPSTVDQFKIGASTLPSSSGNVLIDLDANVTILAPTTGHSPSHIGDLTIKPGALLTVASHTNGPRVLGVGTVFIDKTYNQPQGTLDLKNNR
jgi:hypothetical protein